MVITSLGTQKKEYYFQPGLSGKALKEDLEYDVVQRNDYDWRGNKKWHLISENNRILPFNSCLNLQAKKITFMRSIMFQL